uniref:Vesicle transport protein n=1 Tax=Hemiselmis andersenii TaxID=464988 RepID=A0A7S0UIH9_HEMAN
MRPASSLRGEGTHSGQVACGSHRASSMDAIAGDTKKIGIGLTAAGLLFTLLGVVLFFDGALLAVGNLLFLSGVFLILGMERTKNFFFQKSKLRGTAFFFTGILMVIFKWPKIGFAVELFGFLNLFGNFVPHVILVARHTPGVSKVMELPGIKQACDYLSKGGESKKANAAV